MMLYSEKTYLSFNDELFQGSQKILYPDGSSKTKLKTIGSRTPFTMLTSKQSHFK